MLRANTTHPWEKNSPVFENTSYLQLVYDDLLKNYIKDAARHSRVGNQFGLKLMICLHAIHYTFLGDEKCG